MRLFYPQLKLLLVFAILPIYLTLSLLFIFNLVFASKIMPGIWVNQTSLAGLTKKDAYLLLSSLATQIQQEKIVFFNGEKKWQATLPELGINYDVYQTVEKAYFLGRENLFAPIIFPIQSLVQPTRFEPIYIWQIEKFQKWEEELKKELESEVVEGKIEFQNGDLKFTEGKEGKKIDRENLKKDIIKRVNTFSTSPISIDLIVKKPTITAKNAPYFLETAKKIINKKITLIFEDRRWNIDKKTLFSFIEFNGDQTLKDTNAKENSIYERKIKTVSNENFTIFLNDEKISSFVNSVSQELDRPPQDAKLTVQNGKIQIFQPALNGLSLDQEKTKKILKEKILAENELNIDIPLTVTQSPPKIKTEDVNNIGIKEMLGMGSSNFSGSQNERIYNIELATSRINGTLVPPGEIFSFNQTVGEISESTGYKTAYIIERGRTIFGAGGGVCQVSTTLYRAAIFSGLPIVERSPHAYRVSYYEKAGHPPGLDATISIPEKDFKFKNDTPGYIAIVAKIDKKTNTLVFELWGTNDGRKTEVSKPIIKNLIKPPDPIYEEDPTLPKGTIKQADFAAWGADVILTRKVTRGQETLIDERIYSHYKAWQAIFKIGTKEQQF